VRGFEGAAGRRLPCFVRRQLTTPRYSALRLLLITACVAAAVGLTSCATDLVRTASQPAAGKNGWILLSLGPARSPVYVGTYNVILREKATGALTSVAFIKDGVFVKETAADFSDAQGEGAVYLVELPPGEYEVLNFRATLPQHSVESRPRIPIQVSVESGNAIYIARFLLQTDWVVLPGIVSEKPIYYKLKSVSGTVIDRYDTDVLIARAKFSEPFRSIAGVTHPLQSTYQ